MQETVRQQMLKAMGQTVLVPRFILPNAKPSIVLDHAQLVDNVDSSQLIKEPSSNNKSVDAQTFDNASSASGSETSAQPQSLQKLLPDSLKAKVINDDADPASKEKLRFRHGVFVLPKLICLIDQPMLELADVNKYQQFFSNIHLALFTTPVPFVHHRTFEWPLSGKLAALNNHADVEQVHSEYLLSQAQQVEAKHVLVFGEQVAKRFMAEVKEVYGSSALNGADNLQVHVVEPASSYWQEPKQKRQLWQFLQQAILQHADS